MYRVLCKPGETWVLDHDELLVAVFYGPDRQVLAYQFADWRDRVEACVVKPPPESGNISLAELLSIMAVIGVLMLAIIVVCRIAGGY